MKYTAAILALAISVAAQGDQPAVSNPPIVNSDSPIVDPLPTGSMMTGGASDTMMSESMMTGSMTDSMMSSGSGSMTEAPTPTSTFISTQTTGGMTTVISSEVTPSGSEAAAATNAANYIAPVMGIAAAVAML